MRILLADDHRLMIEGIRNLLAANGLEVLGIASDGLEAVAMAEQLHPDLILMDVRMPRCDGLTATRLIKAARPEQKIVMLTTSYDEKDLFEAIKSGAQGYLLKSISPEAFLEALRDVEEDIPPFSPAMARMLLKEFTDLSREEDTGTRGEDETGTRGHGDAGKTDAGTGRPGEGEKGRSSDGFPASPPLHVSESPYPSLTERQAEVLQLVAQGLTYKEVGVRLSLSERTVRFHMTQIMDRLHLYNRAEVLAYARERGR